MNTSAQVKQQIKKTAQQMAAEPLELLKNAARQVTGAENLPNNTARQEKQNDEVPQDEQNYKKRVAEQDGRHLEALESELRDIRRQKLFNELMQKIQNGEDVSLVDFTELSYEQKDVLKAQIQAVKNRNAQQQTVSTVEAPQAKRGRKMGGGQKGAAKKEETRVEKPVPPSG
jgi:hypothetical protein